jgi:hypothetical protein
MTAVTPPGNIPLPEQGEPASSQRPAEGDIRAIVAEADPSLLLAAMVSITGRTDRIAEFAPHISNTVVNFELIGQMPAASRAELDAWAVDVISRLDPTRKTELQSLDDDAFRQLAETLVGLPVARESVPFLREQGGFVSFTRSLARSSRAPQDFKVVIIGAGMAGVAMSVAAKSAGFDFEVLEKNAGIGGVWWQNR